jgi:hypothetical protein
MCWPSTSSLPAQHSLMVGQPKHPAGSALISFAFLMVPQLRQLQQLQQTIPTGIQAATQQQQQQQHTLVQPTQLCCKDSIACKLAVQLGAQLSEEALLAMWQQDLVCCICVQA